MRFNFYSSPTFEPWDWRNPFTKGIGGSETSHIEMAARLKTLGHEVYSYAPVPFKGLRLDPAGVPWSSYQHADFEAPGVWVIYRDPSAADQLAPGRDAWLICQDVDYQMPGQELTEERAQKFTRIVALCRAHADYLRAVHPYAAEKVCMSSNGIRSEMIRQLLADPPERNPHRLMYASSPDRGMEFLLQVFARAREIVDSLELHVYYGFDNIDKVVAHVGEKSRLGRNADRLRRLLEQPGVTAHGRTPQSKLYREWMSSAIWCHPSNFTETSCITSMDAQALGAIPITSPVWAIAENVAHGVFVEGDVRQPVIQARYTLELIRLAIDAERQQAIRGPMQEWALRKFDWSNFARQWESWAWSTEITAGAPATSSTEAAA